MELRVSAGNLKKVDERHVGRMLDLVKLVIDNNEPLIPKDIAMGRSEMLNQRRYFEDA